MICDRIDRKEQLAQIDVIRFSMPTLSAQAPSTSAFWESLLALLLSNPSKVVTLVSTLVQYVNSFFQSAGLYDVLEHDIRLELRDRSGHQAVYSKRQKVRFLQNNVIAFQDQAWGDGDIFADYKCSPGVPVDRYREGYRYRILISLRQTKNRGDIEEFQIERHIRDGYTKHDGYLQTNIDHPTQKLSLSVVFPAQRKPTEVTLLEQRAERTTILGNEHFRRLANGNWLVEWRTERAKYLENYILRWRW